MRQRAKSLLVGGGEFSHPLASGFHPDAERCWGLDLQEINSSHQYLVTVAVFSEKITPVLCGHGTREVCALVNLIILI